jgi:O-antigen ligase
MIPSKHLYFNSSRTPRPSFTLRELAVVTISMVLLVFMPWAWGGVVVWCTYFTAGLALAALVAAVGDFKTQVLFAGAWFALLLYNAFGVPESATAASSLWLEAVAFPLAALFGQIVAASLLRDDIKSRSANESFKALLRTPPFWIGLALFTYFAIQALNPWGTVVERDLFWRIGKENPIKWLPSGLTAPFSSDETDPGGMNAWRTILIFSGPWLLFCALRTGLLRRRGYVLLAWVSVLTAVVIAGYGLTHQPSYSEKMMGFPIPAGATAFGPFIYRNHAGVYFYLQASIAVSLTFWHLRHQRAGGMKGSPHLIAGFLGLLLVAAALLTYSVAATMMAIVVILFITPAAYMIGMPAKVGQYSRRSATILTLVFAVAFLSLVYANFRKLGDKIDAKLVQVTKNKSDDRAPWRHSTWKMATTSGTERLWTGWGAGSYRWVSPYYQAQEKALQDAKGKLHLRATYAHCDWLQILAEWGIIGLTIVASGLVWLYGWMYRSLVKRGKPEAIPVAAVLLLFQFHMLIDFPLWFTPLLFSLAFIAAIMTNFLDDSLRDTDKSE